MLRAILLSCLLALPVAAQSPLPSPEAVERVRASEVRVLGPQVLAQLGRCPLPAPAWFAFEVDRLAHSALALDIYCWLAQRLHRIPADKPQLISWSALYDQFGQG
jgi:hypothetical protein